MDLILIATPGSARPCAELASLLQARTAQAVVRHFPDGESYVRLMHPVADSEVAVVCGLDHPDPKLVPLLWLAAAVRASGAARVGLVAPYLPYMRQDKTFHDGEIVSARHFAALLSAHFDWLVTVDPHLHRIGSLSEIFSIPAVAVHAGAAVAAWIARTVASPLIVGPDAESRQWVEDVAGRCGARAVVLDKRRLGDREVEIVAPGLRQHTGLTPVLVDDIVSTGGTMLAATRCLREHGYGPPVCVAVHALFTNKAYADLRAVAADVVSCDTVAHPSNRIALASWLAAGIQQVRREADRAVPRT